MTLPAGFVASGVAAGLKPSGSLDLGVIASDRPASAAGVFTVNTVKAAPVRVTEKHVASGTARAIVANAGNANACTGPQGMTDALAMASLTADALGYEQTSDVLVASTGIIGVPLDMGAVRPGIVSAVGALSGDGLDAVARAIMTTDTVPKTATVTLPGGARITGVAKGSGMIAPEMATMLAFVLTDAAVDPMALGDALRAANGSTFNAISVDGCCSTNDCILALANGVAGAVGLEAFTDGLAEVCDSLARQIVEDGEGVTKVVTIDVRGAADAADARKAARAVADSVLFRCAVNGQDPNWGRILAALGMSGASFDPDAVDVWLAGEHLCARGAAGPGSKQQAAAGMAARDIPLLIDLNAGPGSARLLTNDLSAEYVRINAEYTT